MAQCYVLFGSAVIVSRVWTTVACTQMSKIRVRLVGDQGNPVNDVRQRVEDSEQTVDDAAGY
jgi:hypothetical protein